MVDSCISCAHAMPGDRLELEGEIESFSDESALGHGRIFLNGRSVVELKHAVCYLYPLKDLDPPERARIQFDNLYSEGYPLPIKTGSSHLTDKFEKVTAGSRKWVDVILDSNDPERIQGIKNITATEDYFNDHFPLKPILPGVVIMQSVASLAGVLLRRVLDRQGIPKTPVLKQYVVISPVTM